ncbi:hypothetical protein ABZT03_21305 [Streptomyces sp. NPDC005574]|uniref:hypothetical protein n=1 Tax=Streptomyces sp. NPDC005574 TaxID=3156891 RepID=UPI0033AD678B
MGWMAGGAVAMAVMGLAGCSDSESPVADKTPSAATSRAADAGSPADGASADASAPSTKADQSTAEGAVAAWVTAVIRNQPQQACLLMGEAATGSSPARAGTRSTCDTAAPEARQMKKSLGRFRTSFMPEPPTDDPKVDVADVAATGGKALVPADDITVDGKTLDKIILSHSTGVTAKQLDVKVHSTKIGDAWYVTDLDFDIG